jgi:hypothetical protein
MSPFVVDYIHILKNALKVFLQFYYVAIKFVSYVLTWSSFREGPDPNLDQCQNGSGSRHHNDANQQHCCTGTVVTWEGSMLFTTVHSLFALAKSFSNLTHGIPFVV